MIAVALDLLLALVIVEALALALFHARTGRGVPQGWLWPNLAAGFLLMAAVRLALGDTTPSNSTDGALAVVLAGAGLAHVLDLRARWRR